MAIADGLAGFFVGLAFPFGFALVVDLFTAGDGDFDFDAAVLEVHLGGDEGEALLAGLNLEATDFLAVDEKLAALDGIVIVDVAEAIVANVGIDQPQLIVLHGGIGVDELYLAGFDRFYLGSGQDDTGLDAFEEEVLVTGSPVVGDDLDSLGF